MALWLFWPQQVTLRMNFSMPWAHTKSEKMVGRFFSEGSGEDRNRLAFCDLSRLAQMQPIWDKNESRNNDQQIFFLTGHRITIVSDCIFAETSASIKFA